MQIFHCWQLVTARPDIPTVTAYNIWEPFQHLDNWKRATDLQNITTATASKHLDRLKCAGFRSCFCAFWYASGSYYWPDLPTHHGDRLASGGTSCHLVGLLASIKIFLFFLHYLLDLICKV